MTRERITFLVALLLGGLLTFVGLQGKSAPQTWAPAKGDRANYEPAGVPPIAFADENLARYWDGGGSSPYVVVSDKRDLPPQDIDLPPALHGNPAVPEFDPTPDPEFRLGPAAGALIPREPGARPFPAAADLPAMSELEGLRDEALRALADTPKEEGPAEEPKPDAVVLKNGSRREGTILAETDETITMRLKNGMVVKLERKDVVSVHAAQTAAAEYREAARKLAANDAKGHLELARTCLEKRLEAEAVQELNAAIAADAKSLRAYLELAKFHASRTDLESELQVLGRALKAGILNSEEVYVRIAQVYAAVGLPEAASASLEAAVKANPAAIPARVALALSCMESGKYEDAWAHLEKARGQGAQDPAVHAAIARYYFRRYELDSALAAAGESLAKDARQGPMHNLRGVAFADLGKYGDAAKAFAAGLKADPFTASAWVNLGILYVLADKLDEAAFAFAEGRKRDPTAASAVAGTGLIRHLKGQAAEAKPFYDTALLVDPGSYYAHYAMGHACLDLGENAQAVQELTQSLKADSSYLPAVASAGVAFLRDRKFVRAIRLLKRVTATEPTRARAWSSLGLAWLGANDPGEADGALRQALSLEQEHIPAICGLAYAAFFGGRGQEAIAKFGQVLAAKPDDPYVTKALALVKESATRTLWEDTFERSDREDVGKSFFEIERFGVAVGISDRHVQFAGTQTVADHGITALHRVVPGETFLRVEAELDVAGAGSATTGVYVETRGGEGAGRSGVYFARNDKGKLQYAFTSSDAAEGAPRWQDLGVPAEGTALRLGIERTKGEDGQRAFAFLLNGKVLEVKRSPAFLASENVTVGVFGQALRGEKWSLAVNRVRVIEEKRGK